MSIETIKKALNGLKDELNDVISRLDEEGIYGPISFIEEAVGNIESAVEEADNY